MDVPIWRQLEILYIGNGWDGGHVQNCFWLLIGFHPPVLLNALFETSATLRLGTLSSGWTFFPARTEPNPFRQPSATRPEAPRSLPTTT